MRDKMVEYPYDLMMAKFLPPIAGKPDPEAPKGIFDGVPTGTNILEASMYTPLVVALNKYATQSVEDGHGQYAIVATGTRPDKTDTTMRKVDLGMYLRGSTPVVEKRTDWSAIELSVEVKRDPNWDPFASDTNDAQAFLGQIISYIDLVFKKQQRTHYYTLTIFGQYARIARWDRSGCVYSDKIDYKAEAAKLVHFVWRLSYAPTADVRGHDLSATRIAPDTDEYNAMVERARPATDKDATPPPGDHARELFAQSLDVTWPWWKLTIPTADPKKPRQYLVARPTFAAPGVVGRGTRGYVALDYNDPKRPFVYLKDCWRLVHTRSQMEGDILKYLNEAGVSYVPTALHHGDVGDATLMTRDIWMEVNVGKDTTCNLKNHRHYRLVVKEVAKPLKMFKNGKELVWVLLCAIISHMEAHQKAHTMHRDISVGNILIMPDSDPSNQYGCHGLLTDWELSKRTEEEDEEPRHPDRTGTWQFMSVNALLEPRKQITIPDELESFFHVLLYCCIRFIPHTCHDVGDFMHSYFDDGKRVAGESKEYVSGFFKALVLTRNNLINADYTDLVFLRKPSQAQASAANPPATTSSESKSNDLSSSPASSSTPASSPEPSRPSTPTPQSRSEPPKKPLIVRRRVDIPKSERHPIDAIFPQILRPLKAFYELPEALAVAEDEDNTDSDARLLDTSGSAHPEGLAALLAQHNPKALTVAILKVAAGELKDHKAIRTILDHALRQEWPEVDKVPDQLDPNYRPDKEKKDAGRTKREKRASGSRDDDALEDPESRKRPRKTASRA